MSSVVIKKSDGQEVVFKDTIGHQIGNGAVQIMKGNGEQEIYNNFISVSIKLTAKEKQAFKKTVAAAEAKAKARVEAMEKAEGLETGVKNTDVPVLSAVQDAQH